MAIKSWLKHHVALTHRLSAESSAAAPPAHLDSAEAEFEAVRSRGNAGQRIAATHQLGCVYLVRAKEVSTGRRRSHWLRLADSHFERAARKWRAERNFREGYSLRRLELSLPEQWAERYLLADIPTRLEIAAGIVDVKDPRVQTAAQLRQLAEQLLTVVPAARLLLCPSCGLGRRTVGLATAKVKAMVAGARSP